MKKILFLFVIAVAFLAGCQKPYQRKPIQTDEAAEGKEIRYGLCNCYSAYNKDQVTFDVKAYKVNEKNFTTMPGNPLAMEATAADSVALVWRDTGLKLDDSEPIAINTMNSTVTVKIKSGYGNAVVAIFGEGEMLWSFHIWKPRVNPDSTLRYSSLAADVMVLNLGAEDLFKEQERTKTKAYADRMSGLFYQWGRKDPLGRPALKAGKGYLTALDADNVSIDWDKDVATTATATEDAKAEWKLAHEVMYPDPDTLEFYADRYVKSNSGTIIRDWSIKHPTTLIYPSGSYNTFNMMGGKEQWQGTGELWKDDATIKKYWYELKNAYDPCPEGYMLPPAKLYRGFISNSTYVVDDEGEGGSNYSVKTYEGINADARTKGAMGTYGGYNFLYYGALDSSKTTFYPACGYRGGYDTKGVLTDVAVRGRYHGYTSTASYIRIFYFTSNELSAQYGYNPGSTANQVRCIKEMTFSEEEGD